jgi:hypothetical protein
MSSKQESEALLSALLPFAEKMLREHGEFYPYGGYMKPDRTIVQLGREGKSGTDEMRRLAHLEQR